MMAKVEAHPKRIPMSKEQFLSLPEGPPFHDYVNGEAVEVNRPAGRHQRIVVYLTFLLDRHVREKELGVVYADIDVELPTGNVYGPDIVFLSKEHLERYDEGRGDLIGTPDLVVEVLSPSTMEYDRVDKMNDYHKSGVPWVWLIDQDSLAIEEYQWMEGGYLRTAAFNGGQTFRPQLFTELEINLKALLGE